LNSTKFKETYPPVCGQIVQVYTSSFPYPEPPGPPLSYRTPEQVLIDGVVMEKSCAVVTVAAPHASR